ncbi:MAG TPA: SDR family NAD(P)-dependent oxidoreductase [Candidatus Binataceae bacterium]|nr:SDR family NAD(P)-dependent oxidoreductase [Candidatus Binataceae bacterium]
MMEKVLILGATSPISRALGLRFASDGARIFMAARDGYEAARIAQDIAVRSGTAALSGAFDAADFASHEDFVRDAARELGGLDGVVMCFGTLGDEEAAQLQPAPALSTLNQNFTGAVSLITIAARHLEQQRHGFIIIIGSVAGDRGRAKNYVYGAAKGALAIFAQGLRGRLSGSDVHVMTVKLGTVDTRMTFGRDDAKLTVSPSTAADSIYAAWRRRAEVVYVPWFWRIIMNGLRMIPERRFKRVSF